MNAPQFKSKAEAEAAGYVVDTCCYPWVAYQGPRFAPTLWVEVPTDTEAEQANDLAAAQESEDEALARRARARSVTIAQQALDLYRNIADLAAGEAEDVATVKLQLDAARKDGETASLLANFHHQHYERVRVDLAVAEEQIAGLKSNLAAAREQIAAHKTALQFAERAIEDAIYTEDGLEGEAGERVLHVVREAAERGTFDQTKLGELGPSMSEQIAELTAERDSARERVAELETGLRTLIRGYVSTLENGRDRIVMLGGQCDPLEQMERRRSAFARCPRPPLPLSGADEMSEIEKHADTMGQRRVLQDFIEWLGEQKLKVAAWSPLGTQMHPVTEMPDRMIDRFLGIDPVALENERRELLDAVRAPAEQAAPAAECNCAAFDNVDGGHFASCPAAEVKP